MNVVLVGYRGTGKTAVAELLARDLNLQVVHLDAEIQRKAGKAIPDIVAEIGWPGFRDLEQEIVRTFAALDGLIIDCGGGVVEREANFDVLRRAGTVIWLKASTETIVHRIADDNQRPSLTGAQSFTDEVDEVLRHRIPRYQRLAHREVDTDGLTIAEVAAAVHGMLPV